MDIYIEPNLPRPRLVLVGDSPVVETLAAMGRILSYRVLVVAPGLPAEAIPEADEVLTNLESLAAVVSPDTYAVVATMGKYDEFALQILAPSRARYVGLVASRRRAAVVREALLGKGLLRETVDRIQNPAGMDISAHTPEEIALSVMAEVTRTRRGGEPVPRLHEEPAVPSEKAPIQDVVCGMEVGEGTPLTATYAGVVYRLCSEGCRSRFLAGPEKFLQ
jgi:xanthine dehydrogenase accessory factor